MRNTLAFLFILFLSVLSSPTLGGLTVGRTWFDTAHSRPLSGYPVVNLNAAAPIGAHTLILLSIDNLLDRDYRVLNGYPMPGITGAAGFTVRF